MAVNAEQGDSAGAARPGGGGTPAGRVRAEAAGESGPSALNLLTVAEVAELMRVSKMTVYRLVHSGGLPAVRIGRSFRVPEQAVNDYLRDAYIEAG